MNSVCQRPRCAAAIHRSSLARFAAVGLILSGCFRAFGAQVGSGDYLMDVWTGDNGLPNSSVTAIVQTPEGYLWIGTHNGLVRFDGVRFVNFKPLNTPELKHTRVSGLFLDSEHTLWINTYDGSLTSWRNGRFVHEWQGWAGLQMAQVFSTASNRIFATMGGGLLLRQSESDSPVEWKLLNPEGRSIGSAYHQDRDGVIWYNTREGQLGRVNGTNSQLLAHGVGLDGQQVNCLTVDRSGVIWIGTDKGIAAWDGAQFENQTPTNGEPVVAVSFIFCARDGGLWTVANNRVRESKHRQWTREAESWGELMGNHMPALEAYEDRQGGVWFRHLGQGLFYARPNGAFQRISSAEGLPGDRVTCWLQDREANIWVGVDRGGLVHLRERRFQVIGPASGLSSPAAASVCEDSQGAIWIGTFGNGLHRWHGGQLTSFGSSEDIPEKFVFSVCPDARGRLWVSAGREDLFVYDQERMTRPAWDVHGVKAIFTDRQGRVWLGRNRGLSCIRDGGLKVFNARDGIERTDIHAIVEDKDGRIWVGGGGGSLYQFNGERFIQHRPADALANETIWSMLCDEDGTLWVGTFSGGLLRYKEGHFTRYTTANGLPNDIICQILDDGKGNLWLGSHRGIFSVSKQSLHDFARGSLASLSCNTYSTYDGLPTLECSGSYQPSAWRGRDGRLWFTTAKGAVSIQPAEIPVNRVAPTVVIEDVLAGGKSLFASPTTNGETKSLPVHDRTTLRIPPGKRQVEFHYTAPSFTAPEKVGFRYKLEGLENEWMEAGQRREVHYSYLPPGNYTFRVSSGKADGGWSETDAIMSLIVPPRFYETRWFSLAVGITAVMGVAGLVRFFIVRKMRQEVEVLERQRDIERERERIAKDIHDDLGAGLTQIMLQSALAQRAKQEETPACLEQISETAHELVGAMDEIVWAINPESDTLDSLVTYVGNFFQEYGTRAGLRCWLDLPAQPPALVLSAETRHNLYLAVKETLNNVVKHAAATEVSLQFRTSDSGFSFVIKDNGKGFILHPGRPLSAQDGRIFSGHGLTNLTSRLEKIGGQCHVRSEAGNGTEVELTVMLQGGEHSNPSKS